ncbi:MAG TPA: hypothetical protein VFF59_11770 [Anaerolineae bacterium]|nr:hypothetical protein [Anaerolineae bacterium]
MASSVGFPARWLWSAYLAVQLRGQAAFPFRPLAAIEHERDRVTRTAQGKVRPIISLTKSHDVE